MAEKQVKDYEKFVVRFPDGMRDAIAERAKANGRSMNSEIVQILQDAIDEANREHEDAKLKAQFMENRKDLPPSYQEALAAFDSRVAKLIEEATKMAMTQAGLELSQKIEEISKKKPT
ncbi:Arc family DNA-binding protein [Salmonella enterica]|uniref:Arc family DNA-binding protein n=1 Tax=Salmonella typhimurium TaxID=90371 RepID=A0A707Q1A5_SALTM|nr:Arc family DNA-binding protein [Salmonella enterica]EAA7439498.1 Arc family DNA-binding protein [Salmonella enterica subsp. enterica]ECE0469820.1 Arc family DNA-binding protein [Salmonella enterica subsp. enterica serovar Glostrup]EEO9935826.1 Arc family DNA-binding protein [Salmonella enterica subsp. enterica serovar Sandiego]EAM8424446.1 Arc family DNA-binding protein [Salmonella enterica]EAX7074954.1 Arc family DNA-binding protein [Salmonella enterica]